MKTDKTLKLSSYFLKFLMGTSILIAFALAFIYFHSMFSPEKYSNLIVNEERSIVYKIDIEQIPKTYEEWKTSNQLFYYTKLDDYSKFSIIWTKVVGLIILFFVLALYDKFLKNTTDFNLFFKKNIEIINTILKLLFVLFLFDFIVLSFKSPMSMVFEDTEVPHFIISAKISFDTFIYYPLVVIFLVTLKQVFKRGQELKVENDLTI